MLFKVKGIRLTVVAAEDKVVYGLQAEEGKEVPRKTRDPSHVQIPRADAGL